MAQLKHRVFNQDRFLDKFTSDPSPLGCFLALWEGQLPGLPEPLVVDAFKAYLTSPPEGCPAFDQMLQELYRCYDLCTQHGQELMHESVEVNCSEVAEIEGYKDWTREELALRLRTEDILSFDQAYDLNTFLHVDKFTTFEGKEAKEIDDIEEKVPEFKKSLENYYTEKNGSGRVIVRHFLDQEVLNFIVYHEERFKSDLTLNGNHGTVSIESFKYRPARQDFITYLPEKGSIQIENPNGKERDAIRKAFGSVCLGDEEFFKKEGETTFVDLTCLVDGDFEFETNEGDSAYLTEVEFSVPQATAPTFKIRSKNVFKSMEACGLHSRQRPEIFDGQSCFESATIKSAKVKIVFKGQKRGKTVTLKSPGTLAFNRATKSQEVMQYLSNWGLLAS